ncbi:MAG: hypothetical protein K2J71_02225 [Oscillospiraceae bacterium]|nr:hypothetical protein [Oscillospiraceae bacterium]
MKKITILNFILLVVAFCFLATACKKSDKTEFTTEETTVTTHTTIETTTTTHTTTAITSAIETVTTTEITTTTTTTTTNTTTTTTATTNTTTTTTDTITTETTENPEKIADKQLVKAILMEEHEYYTEEQAEEEADWMVDSAEPYSPTGNIYSGEDAIEKARAILIEYSGQDYIDRIEKDFTIYEGQEIKIERDYPPYTVTYYEAYDAWLVFTHPLSGKAVEEDAPILGVAVPGTFPDVLLRANDGKVLGIGDFG